ncbi:tyrosine-type recombinase/integrase [Blautia producta]|uniref:tyrosine-type recombinase/integrase n=1 Tax=Blautia producta TaxID=33035 RepID=UPI0031B565AA
MKENTQKLALPLGITQRPDGRYMGRFTYQGERFTFYDKDMKKLMKKMQEKQYEVEHGFFCKETNITVDKWFSTWISEYKEHSVKAGTVEAYSTSYELYIKKTLGKKKLTQVRPEHIQRLMNQMAEKYSKSTTNLAFIVLNGMYKQAVKNRLVVNNPVSAVSLPKSKKVKKVRVLSMEEQELFLQYAKESRYYDFYIVALNTGMRIGELRGLMWKDVDFSNKTIYVNQTMRYFHKKGTMLDAPKTEASIREIPMLDEVYSVLKKHKKSQNEQKMLLGEMWEPDFGDLVFTNPFGKHISDTAINMDMKDIEEKIRKNIKDFEHIYPHVLRHTFATRGLEKGIPPKVMQELLGHTSITMTLDIYSHVLPNTKAEEIKKIANLFG